MKRKFVSSLICVGIIGMAMFTLSGCIKGKQKVDGGEGATLTADIVEEDGILDLSPDVTEAESLIDLETSVATKTLDMLETEAEIKNKLPKNVLTDDSVEVYDMNGVSVKFEKGLIVDTFVDMSDSYVSEDGMTYLMHEVHDISDTDLDYVESTLKESGVANDKLYKGKIDNNAYVLAEYDEGDGFVSIQIYIVYKNDLHVFTVAKEGVELQELYDLAIKMLESAVYTDIIVNKTEEITEETADSIETTTDTGNTDVKSDIYWSDTSQTLSDTVELLLADGVTTKVGTHWELIDEVNKVYKCENNQTISLTFVEVTDTDMMEQYCEKYQEIIKETFGDLPQVNIVILEDNKNVTWKEYVYEGINYMGKNMNIGAYVGKTAKGICYVEVSGLVENNLQNDYILTVLKNLNTD